MNRRCYSPGVTALFIFSLALWSATATAQNTSPLDLQTATFRDAYFVGDDVKNPRGLSITPDLSRIYITCREQTAIFEYRLKKE
ncbi:MAG: hypothetical protein ACNA78_00480 [Balneolaceae bacterium]